MTPSEAGYAVQLDMFGQEVMNKRAETLNDFNSRIRKITETYCFGEVWAEPTLTRRERSMLVVAILATLGRSSQLKIHLAGAMKNGCSLEEIREVMMQVAIYAGIPAGVEGTTIAEQELITNKQ